MPNVAVVTDDTVGSGMIQTGSSDVFIGSRKVAFKTSQIASHPSGHNNATITGGSSTVFVNGKAIARQGDSASCGHTVDSGRSSVISG